MHPEILSNRKLPPENWPLGNMPPNKYAYLGKFLPRPPSKDRFTRLFVVVDFILQL